ncbi:uncharacterized protein LOC133834062 [Humulus lupulus]|uniref:uncharacterized protein LOC133834062 n=1 Tax=Humulus lupulus TaxID=3486 RepID=UPI002B401470|nr:uncharacterized protein LOC133834062 [Humulus lupulus]
MYMQGESSSQSLPLSSALLKGDVQMKMIGPFNASAPILDDPDIASLVEFIFDPVVPDEILVETDFNFLNRDLIRSLGPGKKVMGEVNTRAALLVSAEDGRAWYLNTRLTVGWSIHWLVWLFGPDKY